VWGHSAPRRNRRQANRQQVIADLFGIVDPVAAAGLFNSLRMMRLPEPPAQTRSGRRPWADVETKAARTRGRITAVVKIASPVWRSASSMGAGRRQWMPDMLASSPTCSVEGLMDDLA
jgi:hypothetical protein